MAHPGLSDADLNALIACPSCDALYRVSTPEHGERAVCSRCHHVLIAPVEGMAARMVALSLAVVVLLVTAVLVPFLEIDGGGLKNAASVLDTARSFEGAHMNVLALAVIAFIFVIPVSRAVCLVYALLPSLLNRPRFPGARTAFRLTEELRPWSMAEVFVMGVAVALVKILDYASVKLDIAFWLFFALVVLTIFLDLYMCRWTIWKILDDEEGGAPRSAADATDAADARHV
ncbi:MAG: paraquat-inducible protein A [Tropicimonas sp.]|uniref:paraquat-inducible protein A n=1 Tax=Tropicimonas sp. TaxID=2067044 RepID=UPI003A89ACCA